ncbi:MAG: septal ring lytic transglycosylase RlpA family protein [Pseudomonadota bacterium]
MTKIAKTIAKAMSKSKAWRVAGTTAAAVLLSAGVAAAKDCGKASYYAQSLAGNATASGEPYNPAEMTAAHKTLPFGTMLRVRLEQTGEEVVVRINDRGPFTPGRVIDLSGAAAREIGLIRMGVGRVCFAEIDQDEAAAGSKPAES